MDEASHSYKDQLVNDVVSVLMTRYSDLDYSYVADVMYMQLQNFDLKPTEKGLVVYHGLDNEKIVIKFLAVKKIQGCSDRTIKMYKNTLEKIDRDFHHKPLSQIPTDEYRTYFAMMVMSNEVSMVYCNNVRHVLSSFYTWLQSEGIVKDNPIKRIDKFKEPKVMKRAFSAAELEMLRDAARKHKTKRDIAIVETLLATGCRVSELCDMNFKRSKGRTFLITGKGNKQRYVYLNARAEFALNEYMEERKSIKSQWVWLQRTQREPIDKRLMPSGVEIIIRNLGKEAGVEDCHPHRFRRTFATQALIHGVDVYDIKEMLGHESVEVTEIYLDTSENGLEKKHERFT